METEKITVNAIATKKAIESAYQKALHEIKTQAENGQEYFRVQFNLPNYFDGQDVQKMLEQHGIVCCERGFSSCKQYNGSYNFDINFKINKSKNY